MSYLFIGDPHFKIDNTIETNQFINNIESLLQSRKDEIDHVILLGDILHTHEKLHTFALNSALRFFKMLTKYKPVYCLVGNHDATSNTIFLTDEHWLNVLKEWDHITIVDTPLIVKSKEKKMILCPYVPDGRFVEALETIKDDLDFRKADVIVGHQLLDGAKMGPIVANGIERWQTDWPLCVSGHIHDKQRPQSNLYYVGSSMQHAFGESADKTVYLYNIHTSYGEEIDLQLNKKEIIYIDIEDIDHLAEKIEKKHGSQVKIVIKGDAADCKAAKKSNIVKQLSKLENVKNIQFKEHRVESTNESIKELKTINNISKSDDLPFELLVRYKIAERNDPYLTSLAEHLLVGGEDLSDKDVLIL